MPVGLWLVVITNSSPEICPANFGNPANQVAPVAVVRASVIQYGFGADGVW